MMQKRKYIILDLLPNTRSILAGTVIYLMVVEFSTAEELVTVSIYNGNESERKMGQRGNNRDRRNLCGRLV